MADEAASSKDPTRQLSLAIGNRIAQVRNERGLTPQELALRSGISRPYLYAIENHGPNFSLDLVRRLAEALDVSFVDLLPQGSLEAASRREDNRYLQAIREGVRETRAALAGVAEAQAALGRADAAFRLAAGEVEIASLDQPGPAVSEKPSGD